jgi:hypothetical protein
MMLLKFTFLAKSFDLKFNYSDKYSISPFLNYIYNESIYKSFIINSLNCFAESNKSNLAINKINKLKN